MADLHAKDMARRARLQTALDSAKANQTIELLELAKIWGVGKPAFVNVRNRIADFPTADVDGKTYRYPRKKALQALDRYERRHDAAAEDKAERLARLVGADPAAGATAFSVSDLQKTSQLRVEMEQRMREQGMLIARADVQQTAGAVFEILSRALSALGTLIDPNGQKTPEERAALDKAGDDVLLRIHAQMRHLLAPDAVVRPTGSSGNRSEPGGAGGHGVLGKRGRGVPKPG